ncbi:MAG: alpha/beta fold hydrolase [Desulfuromonadales bacterium]|jgi:esterase/lipase superfamily enzyme
MEFDYVVCVRNVQQGQFGAEPGRTQFLAIPAQSSALPSPGKTGHEITRTAWVRKVLDQAKTGVNPKTGEPVGDLLVFIHGYNNSQAVVMWRHRRLKADLEAAGYAGAVVSFDWPSDDKAMLYLEDRDDARATAMRLRDDCINLFSSQQVRGCEIRVHALGHSTGAYVIRQAFGDADEVSKIKNRPWRVSQVILIGGDISSRSLDHRDSKSKSLYRHCVRLTNYQNPFDAVLGLSNMKRIGLAPRVGRVGLPDDAHFKAVNINCGNYFATLDEGQLTEGEDFVGTFCHSWHIGDRTFAADLLHTINGDIDRHRIPTRDVVEDEIYLKTSF